MKTILTIIILLLLFSCKKDSNINYNSRSLVFTSDSNNVYGVLLNRIDTIYPLIVNKVLKGDIIVFKRDYYLSTNYFSLDIDISGYKIKTTNQYSLTIR